MLPLNVQADAVDTDIDTHRDNPTEHISEEDIDLLLEWLRNDTSGGGKIIVKRRTAY